MERLAHKPYLEVPGSLERPPKVPHSLRLLTIDLPAVHEQGFASGLCQQRLDKLYPDGVARNQVIKKPHDDDDKKSQSLEIAQKTLVKAYYECRRRQKSSDAKQETDDDDKVHVEIMQASMLGLNPRNMARIHSPFVMGVAQTATKRRPHSQSVVVVNNKHVVSESTAATTMSDHNDDAAELDAPWNQHAWKEEVRLRLAGDVAFGEPLQRASHWRLRRRLYRRCRNNWLGDGDDQKPHAVLANGATLQRVPAALRLLQITCHQHDIPLLVIHDPRKWGGNTHDDLGHLMEDLRHILKRRIVIASLQHAAGRAFYHGRLLGRFETDAAWYFWQSTRKNDEGDDDWSQLDASELQEKLMRHGVISSSTEDVTATNDQYSAGFAALAKQCVESEEHATSDSTPLEKDEESLTEATL